MATTKKAAAKAPVKKTAVARAARAVTAAVPAPAASATKAASQAAARPAMPAASKAATAAPRGNVFSAPARAVVNVSPSASRAPAAGGKTQAADGAADKPKKPKLVRDSFTIPKTEYGVLEQLKQRAAKLGQPAKKSEVLRAGVKALAAMSDVAFLASIGAVPARKGSRQGKG